MGLNKTRSAVRIQLVVLSGISVALSVVAGMFLLWFGLSVEGSQTPGTGTGAEILSAFAVTGVGILLTAFGLFAAGSSIALVNLLDAQDG